MTNNSLGDVRMRIAINAIHARSGGGVTYLRNILPLLAGDKRFELHLFLTDKQITLFHPIDERIRVHAFADAQSAPALLVWEQFALPVLAREMGADIIYSPANFGCLLTSRNVILLRNALSVARIEPRLSRLVYWSSLGVATFFSILRSQRVLAVSNHAAETLSFGLPRAVKTKITAVYHGVSPEFIPDPAVMRENFILVVADIYVQKNLLNFFRAAAIICRECPSIRIKVAGDPVDPWYYERVLGLIDELGIHDKVDFVGYQPTGEILSLYRRCLFLVFPSTAETFGNPLVEAMACGTPIACSNTSAMPEIVGEAGLYFDPLNPAAIAEACLRMIGSENLRTSLAAKGLERSRRFSWEECGRRVADVLAETGAQ